MTDGRQTKPITLSNTRMSAGEKLKPLSWLRCLMQLATSQGEPPRQQKLQCSADRRESVVIPSRYRYTSLWAEKHYLEINNIAFV